MELVVVSCLLLNLDCPACHPWLFDINIKPQFDSGECLLDLLSRTTGLSWSKSSLEYGKWLFPSDGQNCKWLEV